VLSFWFGFVRARLHRTRALEHMRGSGSSQPVSRDLVRIIRESSKLDGNVTSLSEHLRAVDARQAQAVEFYLRACALRLAQTS
jgi:hypothetical protein